MKQLNSIAFLSPDKSVVIHLFVFKDQDDFLGNIYRYLPWIKGLSVNDAPVNIDKPKSEAMYAK